MSLINIRNLTFAYDGGCGNIFENVSLQLDTDWRLGLTGRNGRGKTTLLHLLIGKYAYTGTITAGTGFEYFPYEVRDRGLHTMAVVQDVCPDFQGWELLRELNALDIGEGVLHRPFHTLSNGEQTKVLLAAMFLKENSFLLIDEPTNHLDMNGRALVSRYLRSKKGFILVSHDRAFLDGCIDHILSINRADIEVRRGSFSSWLLDKERQDKLETARNDRLKKEMGRLQKAAKEKSAWSDSAEKSKIGGGCPDRGYAGHKAAKMMKRAKAIEARAQNAAAEKAGLLKNVESAQALKIRQARYHASRLVSLEGVTIDYGEGPVCGNVSFSIERGDRLALHGKNGSGKTSVLRLVCGEDVSHAGVVERGAGLVVSYVSQDTSGLCGRLSDYARQYGIEESLFKAILRKLGFSREQFETGMERFSAGQKKKVLIARSLCEEAHLHVWDEPMNYIDVVSRMQIEELLLACRPTMLFVEHDRVFCDKIATRTVGLRRDG